MDLRDKVAIELYVKRKRSQSHTIKVMRRLGLKIGPKTLNKIIVKYGYKPRTRNETRMRNISFEMLHKMHIENNLTTHEISDILEIPHSTVHNYLKKYNMNKTQLQSRADRSNNYMIWTEDQLVKCQKLLEEYYDYQKVASIMNCSVEAISNINLSKLKVPMSQWRDGREDEIRQYLAQTKDYDKTASKFDIDRKSLAYKNNRSWQIDLSENSNLFGQPTVWNNIKFRSKSEVAVARFIHSFNINFEYEKKIGQSSLKTCDFYIPDWDLWIEYDGIGCFRESVGQQIYNRNNDKILCYTNTNKKFCILNRDNYKTLIITLKKLYNDNYPLSDIFSIRTIDRTAADGILEGWHYLGKAPNSTNHFYGLFAGNVVVGTCTFGRGANKHMPWNCLELSRLYTPDWVGKGNGQKQNCNNVGSFFLARAISLLKKERPDIETLIAYSEPSAGHSGHIYKACNWQYEGQIKSDYKYKLANGSLVHKSRFRRKNGLSEKERAAEVGAKKVYMAGKHKYIYQI